MTVKSRQHADAVVLVTRPRCPSRFDLFTGTACNGGLEGADGRLVPLSHPSTRQEGRLVEGGQEELELPTQL